MMLLYPRNRQRIGVSFLRADRAPIAGRPWSAPRPSDAGVAAAVIARKSNPFSDSLVAHGAAAVLHSCSAPGRPGGGVTRGHGNGSAAPWRAGRAEVVNDHSGRRSGRLRAPISPAGRRIPRPDRTDTLNYYAVPNSYRYLDRFATRLKRLWLRTLRLRSQKDRTTWADIAALTKTHWPRLEIRHPWPDQRFAVSAMRGGTQGRSRMP